MVPETIPGKTYAPGRTFKAMSRADYDGLGQADKDRIVRTRHVGIVQSSEAKIHAALLDAMTQTRLLPDGSTRGPYRHDEIAVLLVHKDDPILPDELRPTLEDQGLEIAVLVVERGPFAQHLLVFEAPDPAHPDRKIRPYRKAGRVLSQPSPPMTVYFAVFDCGMSTALIMGFDPSRPMAESVPKDPAAPGPPSIDPMPRGE